eukprot:6790685-Pyramimonas_sp.AAC.1
MPSRQPTRIPTRSRTDSRGSPRGPWEAEFPDFPMVFEGFWRSRVSRFQALPHGLGCTSDRSRKAHEAPERAPRQPRRLPRQPKCAPRGGPEGDREPIFRSLWH